MLLKTAAVRQGRRSLASPVAGSVLRLLSTEASSHGSTQPVPAPSPAPAATAPAPIAKMVSSAKKKQRIVEENIMTLGADSSQEHSGSAWAKSSHLVDEAGKKMTVAQQYAEFQRIQKSTRTLGSRVERRYVPTEIISNPPRPEDVTLELLMASQTHMGHNTSLWNPANSRYIYGVRQGIHIISLETTAAHLRRAARVVEEVAYRGGIILFVGTRKGQMEIVTRAAELAGASHLFTKWTPGSITNRDVILRGGVTKVVDHLDQELEGFNMFKGTARPLLPDLVVCLNPLENYTMLYECGLKNIPTIGVIDTNTDPSWVTYTIPANDDSFRSIALIAGVLGRAGQAGQKRRLEDATRGNISWQTAPELHRHMTKEVAAAIVKRKEVMGKFQTEVQGFTDEEMKLMRSQLLGEEPDKDVTEEDMLDMMRSDVASAGPGREAVEVRGKSAEESRIPEASLEAQVEKAEEQLAQMRTETVGIEAEIMKAQVEKVEKQMAQMSSATADIEAGILEAHVESAERQLAQMRDATAEIEAEISSVSKKV